MTVRADVYEEVGAVRAQLDLVSGLKVEQLVHVVRHIANISSGFDEDYPSWSPPIATAGEAVAMLRKQLRPLGWMINGSDGFELTMSPCGHTAINIAKGTEHVGRNGPDPETVSDKGPYSRAAVNINQGTFDFIEHQTEAESTTKVQTWWLLYYKDGATYRSELSLPVLMVGKKIGGWRKRILLPEQRLTDPSGVMSGGTDASTPVVVPIRKKQR